MIHRSQFQTTSYAVQLGNALTWLKNQKTRLYDLTATQSEAIRCILKRSEVKDVTAADLMDALQLSQSTVAGVVRRLEEKGLITRAAAQDDARVSILRPTAKGLELEQRLKQSAVETEEILLRGMTAEEQAQLRHLLQKALANINAERMQGGCAE